MNIYTETIEGQYTLLHHGPTTLEHSGFKYIVIYTSFDRSKLYIYKLWGVNVQKLTLTASSFGVNVMYFD